MTMLKRCFFVAILLIVVSVSCGFGQALGQTSYGILIDNTGSLRPQLDREKELAKAVVSAVKVDSSISLFGFVTASDSKFASIAGGVQCSKDKDLVVRQIDNMPVAIGQTTLLDAIQVASDEIGTKRPSNCAEPTEKLLVLITDGEDRASTTKKDDLIKSLKQSSTKVYVIGLIDDLSEDGGFVGVSPRQKSKEFLEKIAKETSGKVIYPKKKQKAEDIVKSVLP